MPVETWKAIADWATIVLIALTVVSGSVALVLGDRINEKQSEQLRKFDAGLTEAKTKAAEAGERAGKLEIEADKQRERAATAEKELLELRQRLAWRRISPKEYPALVSALKPYHEYAVEVTKLGEVEAGQFADDILKLFGDAGWKVHLSTIGAMMPPRYGLQCSVNEEIPAGKALGAILRSLPTASVVNDGKLPIAARIVVGLRPPP
jgi:hypothetical protein